MYFQILWSISKCHWFQEKFQHQWHPWNWSLATCSLLTKSMPFRCTFIRRCHLISTWGFFQVTFYLGGCWWYIGYNAITISASKLYREKCLEMSWKCPQMSRNVPIGIFRGIFGTFSAYMLHQSQLYNVLSELCKCTWATKAQWSESVIWWGGELLDKNVNRKYVYCVTNSNIMCFFRLEVDLQLPILLQLILSDQLTNVLGRHTSRNAYWQLIKR